MAVVLVWNGKYAGDVYEPTASAAYPRAISDSVNIGVEALSFINVQNNKTLAFWTRSSAELLGRIAPGLYAEAGFNAQIDLRNHTGTSTAFWAGFKYVF